MKTKTIAAGMISVALGVASFLPSSAWAEPEVSSGVRFVTCGAPTGEVKTVVESVKESASKDAADSKASKKKADTKASKKATTSKKTVKKKLYKIVHCDASVEWVDAKTAAIYKEEHAKERAYLEQQKAKEAAQKRVRPNLPKAGAEGPVGK